MSNKAIFEVKATVELVNVSDAELNNSEVLHPDVIEEFVNMLLMKRLIDIFEITLNEVLEFDEKEAK